MISKPQANCPRCGGKGRRTRPIDALYTLFRAVATGAE